MTIKLNQVYSNNEWHTSTCDSRRGVIDSIRRRWQGEELSRLALYIGVHGLGTAKQIFVSTQRIEGTFDRVAWKQLNTYLKKCDVN